MEAIKKKQLCLQQINYMPNNVNFNVQIKCGYILIKKYEKKLLHDMVLAGREKLANLP